RSSTIASRSVSRRAPLTSSAATIGGRTAAPCARASSSVGTGRPAKKSIQLDVSTTTLTRLLEVDLQLELAPQGARLIVRPCPADEPQAFDQRLRDPLSRDAHGVVEQVAGKVRGDPACVHTGMLMSVHMTVNTDVHAGGRRPAERTSGAGATPSLRRNAAAWLLLRWRACHSSAPSPTTRSPSSPGATTRRSPTASASPSIASTTRRRRR